MGARTPSPRGSPTRRGTQEILPCGTPCTFVCTMLRAENRRARERAQPAESPPDISFRPRSKRHRTEVETFPRSRWSSPHVRSPRRAQSFESEPGEEAARVRLLSPGGPFPSAQGLQFAQLGRQNLPRPGCAPARSEKKPCGPRARKPGTARVTARVVPTPTAGASSAPRRRRRGRFIRSRPSGSARRPGFRWGFA